jgi:hypothetical protein
MSLCTAVTIHCGKLRCAFCEKRPARDVAATCECSLLRSKQQFHGDAGKTFYILRHVLQLLNLHPLITISHSLQHVTDLRTPDLFQALNIASLVPTFKSLTLEDSGSQPSGLRVRGLCLSKSWIYITWPHCSCMLTLYLTEAHAAYWRILPNNNYQNLEAALHSY